MTGAPRSPLGYGEPVPFLAVRTTQRPLVLASLAGSERILAFVGRLGGPEAAQRRASLRAILESEPRLILVSPEPAEAFDDTLREGWIDGRVILDGDGRLAAGCHLPPPAGEAATVFRLDRALRVVERRVAEDADALRNLIDGWRVASDPPPPRRLSPHPPVLVLDKVFEPAFSAALIRWFEAAGGVESGFMTRDGELTRGRVDRRVKRRRDAFITDPALIDQCRKRILWRLAPAIEAAFQFRATQIERYLVARYDSADRGAFNAHRDNDTSGTAHRRFAVSINLNDAFEGGCLRFPEFGDDVYRPDPGSAVVFSCTLLHEAMPVSAGARYAFLTFLFGDEDMATLERNRGLVVNGGRDALAPQSGPVPGGGKGTPRSA